ncbi:MAG: NHL repeat-containing protein [Acidobacteria bacterium]|nr:NHL repeat-containing protein [Acidobacteriota bacterium]
MTTYGPTENTPYGIAIDSEGNIFTANFGSDTVSLLLPPGAAPPLNLPSGSIDPFAIAVDDAGNVYTANYGSANVSKLTRQAGGGYTASQLGSTGTNPRSLVLDRSGNVYTADGFSNRITKITPGGSSSLFAVTGGGPLALAIDPADFIYVANGGSSTVTRFAPDGTATPFGTTGTTPIAIKLDPDGNIFTANFSVNTITRIGSGGSPSSLFAGSGASPSSMTFDSARNLYVTNSGSATVIKIAPDGTVSAPISTGPGSNPNGITIDSDGNLFVVNTGTNNVVKISSGGGVPDIAPAPPDEPATPTAAAGVNSATVNLPANPADKRYGAPTSYTVTAVEDTSKSCTVNVPATSCVVSGLAAGSSYTFVARANLNAWQTSASAASSPVTPTAPTPTPTPAVSVSALKAKVSKKDAYLTSRVTVSAAGRIAQAATTSRRVGKGSKRRTQITTRCRVSRNATAAGTYALKCNLGSKGRKAIKQGSLRLTVKTTLTATSGTAVSNLLKLTIKRKR